jgi:probable phosphoglycerate mutase
MTQLVLVRHGETVWHEENRYAGSSDVELTERGLEQARWLAEWAKSAQLVDIWCSPLRRAEHTARESVSVTGLAARVDARLREVSFGEAEGLTVAEMHDRFPDALAAFQRDPIAWRLPGGEPPQVAARRFVACLDEIVAEHPEGQVLVVAHSTAIRLALCTLINVPLRRYRTLFPFVRNCGVTEVRYHGAGEAGDAAIMEFNTPVGP